MNIVASAARTTSDVSSALTFKSRIRAAVFQLTVSAAAAASGDLLDVYVQSSVDGGTTYDDFIHFTQVLGNGGAKKFIAKWLRDYTPTTALQAPKDASLSAGVSQGPIGDTIRVKWVITDGGAHGQSFTFAVDCTPVY